MIMTEEEEKKEIRKVKSAFRTAKTYINRYGEADGLEELRILIEEKLGNAPPVEPKKSAETEQLDSLRQGMEEIRQELSALQKIQKSSTEQGFRSRSTAFYNWERAEEAGEEH